MFCSQFDAGSPYAPATQTATLLRPGAQCCRALMDVADMIATEKAVELASTNCVTINACIKTERCLDVSDLRRGFKLPRWRFESAISPALQPMLIVREL